MGDILCLLSFPLILLFFFFFLNVPGHSDLVQQMSPDVLFLKCVTGVLGIKLLCLLCGV